MLLGLFLLCVLLAGWTVLESDISPLIIIGIWIFLAAAIGLWVGLEQHSRLRKLRLSLSQALESGRAREIRIVASGVVEFEEEEDEGACYAFQIADDRIVFVCGQEFYRSAKFPNSDFALIDVFGASGERVEFYIRKTGSKLVPARVVRADVKRRLRLPEHLHVMPGKLEQLEQLLAG